MNEEYAEDERYLLHVSAADRWPAVLRNLGNLTNLGLASRVSFMFIGTAIYVLQGVNDWTEAMERAAQAGATFEVCSAAWSLVCPGVTVTVLSLRFASSKSAAIAPEALISFLSV